MGGMAGMEGIEGLTFVTKANCPLCDKARVVVDQVAGGAGRRWRECDILDDPALFATYRYRVPVLRVNGHDILYGRFPARALRRALGLDPWRRRVACLGLPGVEAVLRAAGLDAGDGWDPAPDIVVVTAEELPELPWGLGLPVIVVGGCTEAPARATCVLETPLYPPDLVLKIDALIGDASTP